MDDDTDDDAELLNGFTSREASEHAARSFVSLMILAATGLNASTGLDPRHLLDMVILELEAALASMEDMAPEADKRPELALNRAQRRARAHQRRRGSR